MCKTSTACSSTLVQGGHRLSYMTNLVLCCQGSFTALKAVAISHLIFNLLLVVHWDILQSYPTSKASRMNLWQLLGTGSIPLPQLLLVIYADTSMSLHYNLAKCSWNIPPTYFRFCMAVHTVCTCLNNVLCSACPLLNPFSIPATHLLCPGPVFPVHILYKLMSLKCRLHHLLQSA